ncbi:hypothetical protein FZ934_09735 [Rhizobium grahamii]|uniref:Uncharacterized protein n=1 Tax=Rhizobium grahamii TaxID=1120045 RepID=A0A5Q0C445_9HYPH|nr:MULTISPECIES: hypothetical protein [Rhizobium]QFY60678.1 hypothetical protein FZ934_09735 [Rhizobium grahamii]QRM50185.1 hypothetical protein F3Y33_13155 [Rhizobium sp. BG6]
MDAALTRPDLDAAADRRSFFVTFFAIYVTALAIVLFDLADGVLFVGDVDDQMRELQIRSLMSPAGRWFDLTLPSISMPEVYISPWSRLIDLPYVAIATMFRPFTSLDHVLGLAFHIWPPVMLALYCLTVAFIVRRLMGSMPLSPTSWVLTLMLMTVLMAVAVFEFVPGRIDHHNAQLVSMMLMMAGFVRWDRLGGLFVGAAGALSIVIGLECLPLIVAAYGLLVLSYVAGVQGSRTMLVAVGAGMIAVAVFAALAFIGPVGVLSTQCDAFSAPYLFLIIGISGSLACAAWALPARASAIARLLWLGLPGLLVLGLAAWLFPRCLNGPYDMIDPVSRALWFSRIWQEKSFLSLYENGQYFVVALLALCIASAFLAVPFVLAQIRLGKIGVAIAFAMALTALLLTLAITRNIRFPIALTPPFLPPAIAYYVGFPRSRRGLRIATGCAVVSAIALEGLRFVLPSPVHALDAVDYMTTSDCSGQDFGVLGAVPAGRIALPQGIALPVLLTRSEGMSVGSVPFHRSSPGMRRMFDAFTSSEPSVRRAALSPFDYVAVCRFSLPVDAKQAPLYAALASGGDWPGLERVPNAKPSDFQLFRIDHMKLQ